MPVFGKIRWIYYRDKLSVCEIARLTSLSRNAVKKWLACDGGHGFPVPLFDMEHSGAIPDWHLS